MADPRRSIGIDDPAFTRSTRTGPKTLPSVDTLTYLLRCNALGKEKKPPPPKKKEVKKKLIKTKVHLPKTLNRAAVRFFNPRALFMVERARRKGGNGAPERRRAVRLTLSSLNETKPRRMDKKRERMRNLRVYPPKTREKKI